MPVFEIKNIKNLDLVYKGWFGQKTTILGFLLKKLESKFFGDLGKDQPGKPIQNRIQDRARPGPDPDPEPGQNRTQNSFATICVKSNTNLRNACENPARICHFWGQKSYDTPPSCKNIAAWLQRLLQSGPSF